MSAKTKQSKGKAQKQSKPKSKAELMTTVRLPSETVEQTLNFDTAVTEARGHLSGMVSYERKIGELAARLEPKYRDKTVFKFAKAIGVEYATLKKYITVFRAYKDKDIGENSPPFGVLLPLAPVPERAEIIKANPNLTPTQARTIARAARGETGKKKPPKSRNDAGTIRTVLELAQKIHSLIGHATLANIDVDILRDALAPHNPAQAGAILCRAGNGLLVFDKIIKEALATPAPAERPEPMWDDTQPAEATLVPAE